METYQRYFLLLVFAIHSTRSAEVKSKEQFVWLNSGQSFTMQCSTSNTNYDGLFLLRILHEEKEVFFLHRKSGKLTLGEYSSRLQTEGGPSNLKITLANVTEDDSGVYRCKYWRLNVVPQESFAGNGSTMVVVNGRPCPINNGKTVTSNLMLVSAISAGAVFLLCLIVLLLWLVPRIKSLSKRKVHARRSDSVYEDMRKSNTPHRAAQPARSTDYFP